MEWNHWIALALLAAAIWAVQIRLKQRREAQAAAGWTPVTGSVVSHGLDEETSRDSDGGVDTTFSPRLTYAYEAAGAQRQGTRLSLDGVSFSKRARAQAWLDERPVGAPIELFVNPANPDEALLTVAHKSDWWVPAFLVGLAAAVAAGLFGG